MGHHMWAVCAIFCVFISDNCITQCKKHEWAFLDWGRGGTFLSRFWICIFKLHIYFIQRSLGKEQFAQKMPVYSTFMTIYLFLSVHICDTANMHKWHILPLCLSFVIVSSSIVLVFIFPVFLSCVFSTLLLSVQFLRVWVTHTMMFPLQKV